MALHPDLVALAARQEDIVGVWQLAEAGWSESAVRHRTAGMTRLFDGVVTASMSPPTPRQHWRAATLTAPDTYLCRGSAAAFRELIWTPPAIETVVRPGDGGPRRLQGLRVYHSSTLADDVEVVDGIPVTTVERIIIDMAAGLNDWHLGRMTREGIRRRLTTCAHLAERARHHRFRRGATRVLTLAEYYDRLAIERCRSDPEAWALILCDRTDREMPAVNTIIDGHEADLYWEGLALIIELDGGQWHRLKDADARKSAAWIAGGKTVRRFPAEEIYARWEDFLALCPPPRHRAT